MVKKLKRGTKSLRAPPLHRAILEPIETRVNLTPGAKKPKAKAIEYKME
jgi:hypothetical protein